MAPPLNPFQEDERPRNHAEFLYFMQEVADMMNDFDIQLPYHGDLLQLQEDVFSFEWTKDCDVQFNALQTATGIILLNFEEPVENGIVGDISPKVDDTEGEALDPRYFREQRSSPLSESQNLAVAVHGLS
jgi:hypothetical protein